MVRMALYSYQDIFHTNKVRAMCTLCCLSFCTEHHGVEAHLNGSHHKELYLKRMQIANSIVVYKDEVHCRLCDYSVCETDSYHDIKKHIQSTEHKETFEGIEDLIQGEFLKLPRDMTPNGSKIYCSICDCFVPGFIYSVIEEHIGGRAHKKARANAVQPLNGIFPVEGTDERLWCKICDESFDNFIETILDHVDEDEYHTSKLGDLDRIIEDEDISIEGYLEDIQEDKAWCNKCSKSVPCNEFNLEQHIAGSNHRIAFAMDIEPQNGIFRVEGVKEKLWCKICKEYFDNVVEDIFDHIDDEYHVTRLDEIKELIEGENISIEKYLTDVSEYAASCNKCGVRITCHEYNLREHIEGRKHIY